MSREQDERIILESHGVKLLGTPTQSGVRSPSLPGQKSMASLEYRQPFEGMTVGERTAWLHGDWKRVYKVKMVRLVEPGGTDYVDVPKTLVERVE